MNNIFFSSSVSVSISNLYPGCENVSVRSRSMMFEPSLTKGVLEVFSPVHSALSAADEQATKAIDIQHANIHSEPLQRAHTPPLLVFLLSSLHLPLYFSSPIRRGRFQRVGVLGEPGVLLLLRLLCGQRRHGHPPGAVQPGGAVRDPAEPHHLLAEPAQGSHPAPGEHP